MRDDLLSELMKANDPSPEQQAFFDAQAENFAKLMEVVSELEAKVIKLKDKTFEIYQPEGKAFAELGDCSDIASYNYFFEVGKLIDASLQEPLIGILQSKKLAVRAVQAHAMLSNKQPEQVINVSNFSHLFYQTSTVVRDTLLGALNRYNLLLEVLYPRSIAQYRYLQNRFLNVRYKSTAFIKQFDKDDSFFFDPNKVEFARTPLVQDNVFITDLTLDVLNQLPRRYTRITAEKRGKPTEVKHLDDFDLERSARTLVEIANPTYMSYLTNPREYLSEIGEVLSHFYGVFSGLETLMREIIQTQNLDPTGVFEVTGRDFDNPLVVPHEALSRLQGIDFLGVKPGTYETNGRTTTEKRYITKRLKLMQYIWNQLEAIKDEPSPELKLKIARSTVQKAVIQKEKFEDIQAGHKKDEVKKEEKTGNHFYVVKSEGDFHQAEFVRTPALNVKISDVYGASFDPAKAFIEGMMWHDKYVDLFTAVDPELGQGANLILIGPVGCGKTMLGKAIISTPRFAKVKLSVPDIGSFWFQNFEKNYSRVMDFCNQLHDDTGKQVVLIMDEFNGWFNSGNGFHNNKPYAMVQNQLQEQLEGLVDNRGVSIMGMSNKPMEIPVQIYSRTGYVGVVGELAIEERAHLIRRYLIRHVPVTNIGKSYFAWAEQLDGATGRVIRDLAKDVKKAFMKDFVTNHPKAAHNFGKDVRLAKRRGIPLSPQEIKARLREYQVVDVGYVGEIVDRFLLDPVKNAMMQDAKDFYRDTAVHFENIGLMKVV